MQQDDWAYFKEAFTRSVEAIRQEYFMVARQGAGAVARERVYCYELYHQLRCRLPESLEYVLHGEIDKAGHARVLDAVRATARRSGTPEGSALGRAGGFNPDFVVHRPGYAFNLAVIEVKSAIAVARRPADARRDIAKLEAFCRATGVAYSHGILLIFGEPMPTVARLDLPSSPSTVEVLWHGSVGQPPHPLS